MAIFRQFLEDIVIKTIHELNDTGSFNSLIEAVKAEKLKKQGLQETIRKYVV